MEKNNTIFTRLGNRRISVAKKNALIELARSVGFEVKTGDTLSHLGVDQITLSGHYSKGALYVWAHVILTSHRDCNGIPVWTVTSMCDFHKDTQRGGWNAERAVRYIERYRATKAA